MKDNSPFGPAFGGDFRFAYPTSTSTGLWKLTDRRISNQSQGTIRLLPQDDSDRYPMPRLGTEKVTDERAHSVYLSPVDSERGLRELAQVESANYDHTHPTDKGRRACAEFLMEGQVKQTDDYVNHSDAASDNSMNPKTLINDIYAS